MKPPDRHEITLWIKSRAVELGFFACGISQATRLESEEKRLMDWLQDNKQGEMDFMKRDNDKRLDPRILLPGAKSVISVIINYYPSENPPEENNYKIAKYAYGKDYHAVIREKLNVLIEDLKAFAGECQSRTFTDSAPVMEKAWAERAGLGSRGKNSVIINPKIGSFIFIGEIITDLELDYDVAEMRDICGNCTKCIDACPTGAIVAPRQLDPRKCISYLTLEYVGELPENERLKFGDRIYGCDTCQDVCPWNRHAVPSTESAFKLNPGLKDMNKEKWSQLTEDQFNEIFKNSSVIRRKYKGLMRNIRFLED